MILRPVSLDQAAGTVLAMTVGPIALRNWYNTAINPVYSITMSSGATGKVKLQGTNDVVMRGGQGSENHTVAWDILPTDGATWADIQAATSTSATGSVVTTYRFIQLVIDTQGDGNVTQAWVKWN